MQEKTGFHQRKLGISDHDRNKCRRFFICVRMVPSHGVTWVMLFPLAPAMSRPLMMKVLYCFSPLLGKLSLPPPSPLSQSSAKQAAVNKISQQDEFEFSHALWNRMHEYSFERVTVEGCKSRLSAGA